MNRRLFFAKLIAALAQAAAAVTAAPLAQAAQGAERERLIRSAQRRMARFREMVEPEAEQ